MLIRLKRRESPADVIVRGAMVRAPKHLVNIDKVRNDLKLRNAAYWQAMQTGAPTQGLEPFLELFRETDEWVEVPRHYPLPLVAPAPATATQVITGRPLQEGPLSKIEPRDEVQVESVEALLADRTDKILALGCGKGKTFVSLYSAAKGKRYPVLVVVHTNALLDQWRQRITDFLGIEPDDVGHIQGPTIRWKGYGVAVAMLHSLVQKAYEDDFYKYWNLVIFDEVHRIGAKTFIQAASMFNAERWGLSATLQRADGMDKAIHLHLGPVAYEDLRQPLEPTIYFVPTNLQINMQRYIFRGGRVNLAQLMTTLADHPVRNQKIMHWLDKAVKDGRTVLVLGERLSQLSTLCETMTSTESKAIHVGSMSQEERRDALTKQVVFATQHLAKEGLDRPAFDTLFILIPFGGDGRLQQSVGRILRTFDDKKDPKVLIFEDDISIIKALGNKMRRNLKKMGYPAKELKKKE